MAKQGYDESKVPMSVQLKGVTGGIRSNALMRRLRRECKDRDWPQSLEMWGQAWFIGFMASQIIRRDMDNDDIFGLGKAMFEEVYKLGQCNVRTGGDDKTKRDGD